MAEPEGKASDPLFGRVDQIGIVVRDVDECVKHYEKFFGEGTFVVVEGEGPATLADGREVLITGKLAFAQLGPIQIELIQIKEGPSVHVDFLENRGEGIHHIAIHVSDFDERLKRFRQQGIEILQQGRGMHRYAYMDTKPIILELIES